jgi:hypothetical protein
MGLRLLMFRQEHTPARSAVLITAGTCEVFLPAGNRVLEAVFTVEGASMGAVVVDVGERVHSCSEFFGT